MKKITNIVMLVAFGVVIQSCTPMRSAAVSVDEAFHGSTTRTFEWGEVYCGQGVVCSEVEVVRVDFDDRDGGRVEVTLRNRTGDRVAVQIALEIIAANGGVLDRSTYFNIGIQGRQEQVWSMPGIMRKGQKVRVLLRALS